MVRARFLCFAEVNWNSVAKAQLPSISISDETMHVQSGAIVLLEFRARTCLRMIIGSCQEALDTENRPPTTGEDAIFYL